MGKLHERTERRSKSGPPHIVDIAKGRKEGSQRLFRDQRGKASNKHGRIIRIGRSELFAIRSNEVPKNCACLGVVLPRFL